MQSNNVMFAELRKQEISNIVQKQGKITVNSLCEHFSVSPATIRNDLTELEQRGFLKRTHGGAISNSNCAGFELTSTEKEIKNVSAKKAIAREAIKLVQPGDVIALDSGTTTLEFATELCRIEENITVITNDLKIALVLEQNSCHTIVFVGGMIRKGFHCTTGRFVVDALDQLHIDKVFMATNGINCERGLSTPSMEMASIKQQLMQISSQVILLADSSKFGLNAFAYFAKVEEIDILVTDSEISAHFCDQIEMAGVRLIISPIGTPEPVNAHE